MSAFCSTRSVCPSEAAWKPVAGASAIAVEPVVGGPVSIDPRAAGDIAVDPVVAGDVELQEVSL